MTLSEFRDNSNLSLEELSQMSGLDVDTLYELENGIDHSNMWAINSIVNALDCDDIIFFGW